jgi:hypothetical protein
MANGGADKRPLYGNWILPQVFGLVGLSLNGTIGLFIALIIILIIATAVGIIPAVVLGAILALVVFLFTSKDKFNLTLVDKLKAKVMFKISKVKKENIYKSGLYSNDLKELKLPGILTGSNLYTKKDVYDNNFTIIELKNQKTFSIPILLSPNGSSLVDIETINNWVYSYGQWINYISNEPGVIGIQVTVESSENKGDVIKKEIDINTDVNASKFAKTVLKEIKETYPLDSYSIKTFITIIFSSQIKGQTKSRDINEFAIDVSARIPHLVSALTNTGSGAVKYLSGNDLKEYVATAYDPDSITYFSDMKTQGKKVNLKWNEIGPTHTQSVWNGKKDYYIHDSAFSKSYFMMVAPKGNVTERVLYNILAPNKYIKVKRINIYYKTINSSKTAELVQKDVDAARFNLSSRGKNKRIPAIKKRTLQLAEKAEAEESLGAGLVEFALSITITVDNIDDLKESSSIIENLASTTRIRIRNAYGSQDSAFAASLPLGIILSKF